MVEVFGKTRRHKHGAHCEHTGRSLPGTLAGIYNMMMRPFANNERSHFRVYGTLPGYVPAGSSFKLCRTNSAPESKPIIHVARQSIALCTPAVERGKPVGMSRMR